MNVAIIPARGGSQRIPGKNIRLFHGRPIISYSIEFAKNVGLFDQIYVSTDRHQIADIARLYGAKVVMRSEAMSQDNVGTQEVAAHVLGQLGIEDGLACVIYATAPMIDRSYFVGGYYPVRESNIDYSFSVFDDGEKLIDAGQWYWGKVQSFMERKPLDWNSENVLKVAVPIETACDINVEEDWLRAEDMYDKWRNN